MSTTFEEPRSDPARCCRSRGPDRRAEPISRLPRRILAWATFAAIVGSAGLEVLAPSLFAASSVLAPSVLADPLDEPPRQESDTPKGTWVLIGPEGGRVMALNATADLSQVHAAILGGGVFRSLDGARTWQPTVDGMEGVLDLQTLARDPADPDTLWAGSPAAGVLRSRDGGRTWQRWNTGLHEASVKALRAVAVGPGEPTVLYAGTIEGQVWRRAARAPDGESVPEPWQRAGEPLGAPVFVVAADPRDPARLWAGTAGGLFRSVDGGSTWIASNEGLPSLFIKGIAASPFGEDEVWSGTGAGAARSTDGGRTWQALDAATSGLPPVEVRLFVFEPQRSVDPEIPTEARMWIGTAQGLFVSRDGGDTWQPDSEGLPQLDITGLLAVPEGLQGESPEDTLVLGMAGAGVALSPMPLTRDFADSSPTWALSNEGLTGTAVDSLAADPLVPGLLWAGVAGRGVLAKPPGDAPWIFPGSSPGAEPVLALQVLPGGATSSRVLLAALAGRGLRRSVDQGRTWQPVHGLPVGPLVDLEPVPAVSIPAVSIPAVSTADAVLAALPGSGIYGSDDLGATWEPRNDGLTDLTVRALAAAPSSPETVYAATDRGEVFVSHDGGGSWNPPGPGPALGLRALAVDPEDAVHLFAGTARAGVFESGDGGRTWSPRNIGLEGTAQGPGSLEIRDLVADAAGRLWAATAEGVFVSRRASGPWRRAAPGLPLTDVLAVLPNPGDPQRVWAALNGRGVAVLERGVAAPEELTPRRLPGSPNHR